MTLRSALAWGEDVLNKVNIADARNDAWLLLTKVTNMDRTYYYMHMDEELSDEHNSEYESLIAKRAEHVPLQYITGEQEFMGLNFKVTPSVLIPRQDTEILVLEALKVIRAGMRVMDMCTGSGCILISILKNCLSAKGTGYDISKQAINIAKENAKLNGVTAEFERSDLFEMVEGTFDVIVSNPPYIPTDVITTLMPEVRDFEPMNALDGMEDGLFFYRKIVRECRQYLNPNGKILFEIGHDQGEAVSSLLLEEGFGHVRVVKDLAGLDRVVIGELDYIEE